MPSRRRCATSSTQRPIALGLVYVVQGLDGVPPRAGLRGSAVEAETGIQIAVCSFDSLREMKRAAGVLKITSI